MIRKLNQKGFSIAELIIVISVYAVLIGLIMIFTISYTRYGSSLQLISDAFVSRLNVSDYLREKIGSSSGLIGQNSIQDDNPGVVDTSVSPAKYWILKHAIPGNIPVGASGVITPIFYFKRYSQTKTGSFIMNGTSPYEDEYVLYMNGSDKGLYVRTLANPNASGNKVVTTCPPSIATSSCPADALIMSNMSSVDVRYFSRSGNTMDWTSIFDTNTNTYAGPDFPAVEVVELKLNTTVSAKYQSNQLSNTTIIRVALRNT